jgi:hypothetical protein
MRLFTRLMAEPPFRLFTKHTLALFPCSVRTRVRWDLSERPPYLTGTFFAARQARDQGISEISVIEFGVAGGHGLLVLQAEAEAVERATGVKIRVYGFDAGPDGMPSLCGDYRDLPDLFKPGDFPMDVDSLRARLAPRTTLVVGDIRENIERFRDEFDPSPIGFIAMDVDLYSSTVAALRVLDLCLILRHVAIYLDDIELEGSHRWAGELLAIDEFNETHTDLKIDKWRGLRYQRPFAELPWFDQMFICHDLESISKSTLTRERIKWDLDSPNH